MLGSCGILCLMAMVATLATVLATEYCKTPGNIEFHKCVHKVNRESPEWNTATMCNVALHGNHQNKNNNKNNSRNSLSGNNNGTKDRNKTSSKDVARQQISASTQCTEVSSLCKRMFRLSIFKQQLYSLTMKKTFLMMLSHCCACNTPMCSVVNVFEHPLHMDESQLNDSDIVFPVIAQHHTRKLNGYHFLPAFQVPSSYFVYHKEAKANVILGVIVACLRMWPFLLVCILATTVSGFVIWRLERQNNGSEYSKNFVQGMCDGFWWSWITMSSVGYGDKVPKSYLGKLHAVIWILVGITISSLFTAQLTNGIINAHNHSNEILGKTIAVLKDRLHDVANVAQHGGIVKMGTIDHTVRGFDELISMMMNHSIDGFFVDRNTYRHVLQRLSESKYNYIYKRMLKMQEVTMRIEKPYRDGKLACGLMFRDEDTLEFFRSFFESNYLQLSSCNSFRMNTKHSHDTVTSQQTQKNEEISQDDVIGLGRMAVVCVCLLLVFIFVRMYKEGKRYFICVNIKLQDGLLHALRKCLGQSDARAPPTEVDFV